MITYCLITDFIREMLDGARAINISQKTETRNFLPLIEHQCIGSNYNILKNSYKAKLEDLTEKLEKDKISSKELELLQRLVGNDQNSNMTYQVTQSLPKSITDPIVVSLPHSIPVQTIQITNQIKSSNKNTLHSQLSEPKSNGNSC